MSELKEGTESSFHIEEPCVPVPDGGAMAWVQVAGAFCVNLTTWGIVNTYGVYQTYYESNLLHDESKSNIAWIGSVQGGLLFILTFIAGPICDIGYFNKLIYTGAFLNVTGIMLTSICTKYWQILLTQGVMVGVGSGLLYLPGASIISQYFKKRSAFAFGVASLGSSVGSIIYPVIFRQLEPRIGFGWPTRVIGFTQVAALVLPVFGMRERLCPTTLRRLLDWNLFKQWSFLLVLLGMLFGYMGIYISFFYVELYALEKCRMPIGFASYILAIMSAGSLFGRLLPTYLADRYAGPVNLHTASAFAAAVLVLAWIAIESTAGIVVFGVLYGFVSGSLVSLGGPVVFSLTDNLQIVGTCLGMITGACGLGLLLGSPIAGAILDQGGWSGLQAWNGALLVIAGILLLWSRMERYGTVFWKKV